MDASSGSLFVSVWIVAAFLTFVLGLVLTIFPKELPQLVMRRSLARLANIATSYNLQTEEPVFDGFFESTARIFTNNKLAWNICAIMFAVAAMKNFQLFEKHFNQTKYHIPTTNDNSGYSDPEIIQFTTNMLRQPMIAVSMIASALVVNRIKPRSGYLLLWNVFAYTLSSFIFASTIFINCTTGIYNEKNSNLIVPACSNLCQCTKNQPFEPVCVDGITYFSGCLAGCEGFNSATQVRFILLLTTSHVLLIWVFFL